MLNYFIAVCAWLLFTLVDGYIVENPCTYCIGDMQSDTETLSAELTEASETVSNADSNGTSNGELLVYTMDYPNLQKVQSCFTARNGLALRDIKRVFCLDLGLGNEFENAVLSRLDSFFRNVDTHFALFLLNCCIRFHGQDADLSKDFELFMGSEQSYLGHDKNVRVIFRNEGAIDINSRSRIQMVANGIFRKKNLASDTKNIEFEQFQVEITKVEHPHIIRNCQNRMYEFIFHCYPDTFLSVDYEQYLDIQGKCFNAMLGNQIPEDVKSNDIKRNPIIDVHLDNDLSRLILYNIVDSCIYEDYCDFRTRIFSESPDQDTEQADNASELASYNY